MTNLLASAWVLAACAHLAMGACSEGKWGPPETAAAREERRVGSEKPAEATMQSVRIAATRTTYSSGEEVSFEIENGSAQAIHFTEGCSRPSVERLEGGEVLRLTTSILESVPDPTTIGPGATKRCVWDGRIWQDPALRGRRRFASFVEALPAPPGRYRLRLDYVRELSESHEPLRAQTVHSPAFVVE